MLLYSLLAGAGYGIAKIEPSRLWQVGRIAARTETLEAISSALALKNAVEHPEIWYATYDVECTPVLWPKDRLYALGQLIEEKRHEEVIWGKPVPETLTESALWGLKRIQDALARKFSSAGWQLKQIQKVTAPIISNPGDVKLVAEYYRDHPTFVDFAISSFSNITDFFNRRRFKAEHENDYMVYLNAANYNDENLEWVNLPKGLEKEIYHAMKNISKLEAPPSQGVFSRIWSGLVSPLTFFKKLTHDYKVLAARREAKKMLLDDTAFPGFNVLMDQDPSKATLTSETAINELARILIDKNPIAPDQISTLKRTISNQAEIIQLQNTKDKILFELDRAFSNSEILQNEIKTIQLTLNEKEELIQKTNQNIEHQIELTKWAVTALEIAEKKIASNPESSEKIKNETIPAYEKQLKEAMHLKEELEEQLHQFKKSMHNLQNQLNGLSIALKREGEISTIPFIENFRSQLKSCNPIVAEYLKQTIQSAPNIKDLNEQNIDILLKCALHPNFLNLPKSARDVLFFHILENKSHLSDYYEEYLMQILDLAKPGINIKTKEDNIETELFNQKDKWFGELFSMPDLKSFRGKIDTIKRIISSKLEVEVRKDLHLQTDFFWQSAIKKLNLYDIPDLDEHQKLFNDRILEHDVLRIVIRNLQQELYETASISDKTKESIPKLIENNTREFFITLKSAQTKLREEKGEELDLMSESFRKMYEYWATSLMIDPDPKASKDELNKMAEEIDRLAQRFKLYAVRQLLFPFVKQTSEYQALPKAYQEPLLDTMIVANSVSELVQAWQLIPKKMEYLQLLANHPVQKQLAPAYQDAGLIESIAIAQTSEKLELEAQMLNDKLAFLHELSKNKTILALPDELQKELMGKITAADTVNNLRGRKRFANDFIKNVELIQSHERYHSLSKTQEYTAYASLLAAFSSQKQEMAVIRQTMSQSAGTYTGSIRSWGAWLMQPITQIASTVWSYTPTMPYPFVDPRPIFNQPYSGYEHVASTAIKQLDALLVNDSSEKDKLMDTLYQMLGEIETPSLEQKITSTLDVIETVKKALTSGVFETKKDNTEKEIAPEADLLKPIGPSKKSGA
ncbi:MAG: hypothetical protein U1E78_09115 [Gammaproteobacteria bacterium]